MLSDGLFQILACFNMFIQSESDIQKWHDVEENPTSRDDVEWSQSGLIRTCTADSAIDATPTNIALTPRWLRIQTVVIYIENLGFSK